MQLWHTLPETLDEVWDFDRDPIEGSLRIGLGKFTTESDIITAAELLSNAVVDIRNRVS
jgi:cysteine sulfinate desulfinase/cysteine desulfurase-like protein